MRRSLAPLWMGPILLCTALTTHKKTRLKRNVSENDDRVFTLAKASISCFFCLVAAADIVRQANLDAKEKKHTAPADVVYSVLFELQVTSLVVAGFHSA
ncbi:unnamed protein product [Soboliphyme baturini]|uniref:Secreted protein n=1 Tax=Soboliphyme baturini TaxID=241478 RepID=A0A183ILG0_9BILA|nr:unnamed protein product [Soboliphyme baturini]